MSKRSMATAVLLAITLSGCITTGTVTPSDDTDLNRINSRGAEHQARVELVDGSTVQAQALQMMPDSTSWVDARSGGMTTVPTDSIALASFTNRGQGALIGAGAGAVAGGLIYTTLAGGEDFLFPISFLLIEVPTTLVGTILGASIGRQRAYRINVPSEAAAR